MKFNRLSLLNAELLLSASILSAQSNRWTIDPNHTQTTFVVKHMMITNVHGAVGGAKGVVVWDQKDPSQDSVEVVLDATTLDTQSAYRDKDIKGPDWFNVDKYPTLTFKSTSVERAGNGLKIAGNLTIAGVTKPVVLDATEPTAPVKGMQGGLASAIEAKTTIKRTDFNFGSKYPNAMVGDEIQITIDVEMDRK